MKRLHTLNPLHSEPQTLAAVGQTQGGRRTTGVSSTAGRSASPGFISTPDPEVPEKKRRKTFTAAYKLRVLREAELCLQPCEIGDLLRREGLYSSHLTHLGGASVTRAS